MSRRIIVCGLVLFLLLLFLVCDLEGGILFDGIPAVRGVSPNVETRIINLASKYCRAGYSTVKFGTSWYDFFREVVDIFAPFLVPAVGLIWEHHTYPILAAEAGLVLAFIIARSGILQSLCSRFVLKPLAKVRDGGQRVYARIQGALGRLGVQARAALKQACIVVIFLAAIAAVLFFPYSEGSLSAMVTALVYIALAMGIYALPNFASPSNISSPTMRSMSPTVKQSGKLAVCVLAAAAATDGIVSIGMFFFAAAATPLRLLQIGCLIAAFVTPYVVASTLGRVMQVAFLNLKIDTAADAAEGCRTTASEACGRAVSSAATSTLGVFTPTILRAVETAFGKTGVLYTKALLGAGVGHIGLVLGGFLPWPLHHLPFLLASKFYPAAVALQVVTMTEIDEVQVFGLLRWIKYFALMQSFFALADTIGLFTIIRWFPFGPTVLIVTYLLAAMPSLDLATEYFETVVCKLFRRNRAVPPTSAPLRLRSN